MGHRAASSDKVSKNALSPMNLCRQDDRIGVGMIYDIATAIIDPDGPFVGFLPQPLINNLNSRGILPHVDGSVVSMGFTRIFPVDKRCDGRPDRDVDR